MPRNQRVAAYGAPKRVRLTPAEEAALAERAAHEATTESAVMREALRRYLASWPSARDEQHETNTGDE